MDANDKQADQNGFTQFLAKPVVSVIVAAIVGMTGATGVQMSIPARSDAFTSGDALKLEYRLMQHIEQRVNERLDHYTNHELIHVRQSFKHSLNAVQNEIPPQALRDRVIALEESARRKDADFKVPTRQWRY